MSENMIVVETRLNRENLKIIDKWRKCKIMRGSPVDRALNGEEGETMDYLRKVYRRLESERT